MPQMFHDRVHHRSKNPRRDSKRSPVEHSVLVAVGSDRWLGRSYARSTGR
jgi:hypothetical protein